MDNETKDYIYNRFKEGKEIAQQFNLPLKNYGYPI